MKRTRTLLVALLATSTLAIASPVHADHGIDLDCADFDTRAQAQAHLDAHPGDPDLLDADGDGLACETLPGGPSAPSPAATGYSHDWNGDGENDVLAIAFDGTLRLYGGDGRGGFVRNAGVVIGRGWQVFDQVRQAGDLNGDGAHDLVARIHATGALHVYNGDGRGGFARGTGQQIGRGWQAFGQILAPGDWTGDGRPDLLAHANADASLWLYPGTGTGGFGPGRPIGRGFPHDLMTTAGDWTGDGANDLVVRRGSQLYLYAGDGAGGFARGTGDLIGTGWFPFTALVGPGEWTVETPDLLARDRDGRLLLYVGDGNGGFTRGTVPVIGRNWDSFALIF